MLFIVLSLVMFSFHLSTDLPEKTPARSFGMKSIVGSCCTGEEN